MNVNTLGLLSLLLGACALFAYANEKIFRLPINIGLMLVSLVAGLLIIASHRLHLHFIVLEEIEVLTRIDFNKALMNGMLCFLLFAGAIVVPIQVLKEKKWSVAILALLATVFAAFLGGIFAFGAFAVAGAAIPFVIAMIFGSLISPTDPIAALAILSPIGLPKKIETLINGESLLNDGVGVVLFTTFTALAAHSQESGPLALFFREVAGGILLGALFAAVAILLLKGLKSNPSALLVTLAAVGGCYTVGVGLEVSGPIATVVLGLLVGAHLEKRREGDPMVEHIRVFWHFLDDILNSILFVLLGLQILVLDWPRAALLALPILIPLLLAARWLSVAGALRLLDLPKRGHAKRLGLINLLTWTGMRGGLAVALAMSLLPEQGRDLFLTVTFGVVAFSILVQGLTIKTLFPAAVLRAISRET